MALSGKFRELFRFVIVGCSNTVVDLSITNLLIFAFSIENRLPLMVVSVFAGLVAILNSYVWNRWWTFQRQEPGTGISRQLAKFLAISLIGVAVNTSVFLFCYYYISNNYEYSKFLVVNISKFAGICAVFITNFLGYKISVFGSVELEHFRESYAPKPTSREWPWLSQALVLSGAALLTRLAYLTTTTAISGEAVYYGNIAESMVSGQFANIDFFWVNLFCFWEALIALVGLTPVATAIASSLIPGILLVLPVIVMTRLLFGHNASWIAGWLFLSHPRLIEYSANGYPESLYLLGLATGLCLLIATFKGHQYLTIYFAAGLAFGVSAAVSNECFVLFSFYVIGLIFAERAEPSLFRMVRNVVVLVAGFVTTIGLYILICEITLGTPAIFQSLVSPATIDQLPATHQQGALISVIQKLKNFFTYAVQRLPGVLLTPTWIFALLLPFLSRKMWRFEGRWLLLLMLLFPLISLPSGLLEPRYFFPILIPIHVLGAAGLVAFCAYLTRKTSSTWLLAWVTTALVGISLVGALLRGVTFERNYNYNRVLAAWIQENIAKDQTLLGDDYGYVSATAFLAGYPSRPRPSTDSRPALVEWVREHNSQWLIIYESYLKKHNPAMLPALDQGFTGMALRFQTLDSQHNRVQIYQIMPSS